MQKLLITILLVTIIVSCNETKTSSTTKTLDFGAFSIHTPSTWVKIKEQGIDSYVGRIAIDKYDTIEFDLGWYSNELTEYEEVIIGDKTFYFSTYDTAYSPTLFDSINGDKVVTSKVIRDTINGRVAKILKPVKSGIGTTGIYVDSLWKAGSGIDRFNLYGRNLKPENEKALIAAFKTLRFHKKD